MTIVKEKSGAESEQECENLLVFGDVDIPIKTEDESVNETDQSLNPSERETSDIKLLLQMMNQSLVFNQTVAARLQANEEQLQTMNQSVADNFRVINQKVSRLEGTMNKKFDNVLVWGNKLRNDILKIDKKLSKAETKILVVESKVGEVNSSLSNKIQSVKNELVTDREENAKCFVNVNNQIDTVCVNVKAMAVDLESRVDSKLNVVDDKVETVSNTVKLHEIETKRDVSELKSTVSELNQKFEIFSNELDRIIDKVGKPKNYFNHAQRGGDHSWGNTNFNRRENSRPNNHSFHHREQNSHNINNNFRARENYNFHSRGQSGNNWNRSNYRDSENRNWREHSDTRGQNAMGSPEAKN
ncbi:uncharacterized protein DDB_G0287625-like [Schistocerca americana]|uniref:uncharacterized protein DDB_G0287625-like n=1 Tax=Schistocerca americana TaxID=7009 RepID=UPI001F50030F|nr:uncharacterized protein DDB_G0287625-like [Schistocerca americana]